MLRPYCGEYLVSPIPMHFGFNACSHGCFYCFANLNKPDRRVDMQSLVRILKKLRSGETNTVESWLLSRGYPVLMSNDSDPLAASNIEVFKAAHEALGEAGARMCYQTKGGKPEDEAIILKDAPTMIYVSLTSDNEDLLRQAEPGAPGHTHRLDFIRRAKACGHLVIVGLNPLIHWWWDDFNGLIQQLKALDVRHVWNGALHLTPDQINNMSVSAKRKFTTEIAYAKRRKPDSYLEMYESQLKNSGINVFQHGKATHNGFWDSYFALGYPFYPTADGFFAYLERCEQQAGEPQLFGFRHFDAWASIGLDVQTSAFKEFLKPFRRTIYNATGQEPKVRTLSEVNRYFYDISAYPTPLAIDNLFLANGTDDAKQPYLYTGEGDDLPLLVYTKDHVNAGDVFWDIDKNPVKTLQM
ncbi:MAG: radical SAM protein [Methylococcaceae bacterium]|nr:MAG: radical SAM protein [Methylococcaceae bacterium]